MPCALLIRKVPSGPNEVTLPPPKQKGGRSGGWGDVGDGTLLGTEVPSALWKEWGAASFINTHVRMGPQSPQGVSRSMCNSADLGRTECRSAVRGHALCPVGAGPSPPFSIDLRDLAAVVSRWARPQSLSLRDGVCGVREARPRTRGSV